MYYMNTETVKRLAKAGNASMSYMAETLKIAQNTFSTKAKRDTIKDEDRRTIADSLGAVYVCGFLMPDGAFISDYSDAVGMKLTDDKAEIIVSTLNNRKSQQVDTTSGSGDASTQQNPPISPLVFPNSSPNPAPKNWGWSENGLLFRALFVLVLNRQVDSANHSFV